MNRKLDDEYQFEVGSMYSTLEHVGDYEFQTDPNASFEDDPYADIYEDAVYGGRVDPSETQHFYVYRVEWEGEEQPDEQGPSGKEIEDLGEELNSVFEGWIINSEGDRVFALSRRNR